MRKANPTPCEICKAPANKEDAELPPICEDCYNMGMARLMEDLREYGEKKGLLNKNRKALLK